MKKLLNPTKLALALACGIILTLLFTAQMSWNSTAECTAESVQNQELSASNQKERVDNCTVLQTGYPLRFLSVETILTSSEYTEVPTPSSYLEGTIISSSPYIDNWKITINILFWSLISWIIIAILSVSTTRRINKSKKPRRKK